MQRIISDGKVNAEGHEYRNFKFLRSLKWKCGREVDQAARQYHDKAFAIIDCISGNCKGICPYGSDCRGGGVAQTLKNYGGADETRTRDLRRDRPAF